MNPSDENQKPYASEKGIPAELQSGISGQEATSGGASRNPGERVGRPSADDETAAPFRLIDEIVGYLRTRQGLEVEKASHQVDEERLARAALYQLRKHPVPTALLGFSALWLLFAESKSAEEKDAELKAEMLGPDWVKPEGTSSPGEESHSEIVTRVEEAVVAQVKEGYDYTSEQLKEVAARYPWAAAAVAVGGGILAAIYLPKNSRKDSGSHTGSPSPEERLGTGPRPEHEPATGEGIGHEPITGKTYIRE